MPLVLATLLANCYPVLHATAESDAVFVDNGELEQLFSDAAKRLAERYGCFVVRDITFITLATGTALYNLPARHLSTLHVTVSNRPLVAASREELERRDATYETTAATVARPVARFYEDKHGANRVGFHPVPSAAQGNGVRPEVIYHQYPCEIEDGLEAPLCIGDYLEACVIGEAYNKESDLQQPEVAKSCMALKSLYEAQIENLWGMAQ